jgi:hypothetical protein
MYLGVISDGRLSLVCSVECASGVGRWDLEDRNATYVGELLRRKEGTGR